MKTNHPVSRVRPDRVLTNIFSPRNRKNTANGPGAQESYSILISISSTRARRDGKSSYGLDWQQKAYDIVSKSWIINCLKMYMISEEIINFDKDPMKIWRVGLTEGKKNLAKIQRGIFQGDTLSPLLSVIVMMPLNHMLRKFITGYKLSKS